MSSTFSSMLQRMTRWALLSVVVAVSVGCATRPDAHPQDPFETFNRDVYRFNEGVDEAVVKPVAIAYRDVTPDPVRTGVSNFFGNLGDVWSTANAVLQLRPREAAENWLRVSVNTVFGLGGLLDIASEMGIERTKLDFGLTLGRWGIPSGPYLVLPFMGPSTIRDVAGTSIESRGDLVQQLEHIPARNSLYVLRLVDTRTNLLRATSMLEGVALDKYSFTRDVYLQRRDSQIEHAQEQMGNGIGIQRDTDTDK
jgi:phospholipid-binding lipoprotein MlaA